MRSPRLAAGLLATLVAFSACTDSPSSNDGGTAPTLAEAPLAETTVGASYLFAVSATGSTTPYTFAAQGLPPGLTLNSGTGLVTGSATTAGDFPVEVSVQGANGKESSKAFTLKVYPAVSFKQNSLPAATLLSPYSATLEAEGGKGPLTLKLIAGDLPAGITFNASTGQLSGSAPGSTGIALLNFEAIDVHGARATRSATLQVAEALRVSTTGLGQATEGVEYLLTDSAPEQLSAPFAVGSATFAASGLPQGLSVDPATGRLSGTPEVGSAGSYTVAVTVTDSGSRTATQSFPLQVMRPGPLMLGGVRGMPPTGGRITNTLTVFITNGRVALPGVGVRVRKNGQEYSPPKQALTDAEGKAVFTGLGLNGTSDTVDITANGAELINTTLARVNASLVTLRMAANPVFGGRVFGNAVYEPTSGRLIVTSGHDSTNVAALFYTACHNDVIEAVDLGQKQFRTLVPGGQSTSPSPRYDAAMAAADGVAVFFGGRNCIDNGDGLGDTWEFQLSTNTWTRVSPTTAPLPRRAPALLREPSGSSVLLVGGFRNPSY
ncbi:MAG TPA: putative Ig domain-containing protein, partial [Myxococcaceae bacterium]